MPTTKRILPGDNLTHLSDEVKRFRCKGSWTPPSGRDAALDTFINTVENDIMTSKPATIHNNLSKQERKALTKLRKRTDIVIKPADKGSGTVVMDSSWYINECHRQLNDAKYYKKNNLRTSQAKYTNASKNTLPVYTKTILLTMRHLNTCHPTLIQDLAASTYYPKTINKAILADPSYPATATLLKEFPSLSTTT